MTTIKTDNARAGEVSKNHRILRVLAFSLGGALLVMLGVLAFG